MDTEMSMKIFVVDIWSHDIERLVLHHRQQSKNTSGPFMLFSDPSKSPKPRFFFPRLPPAKGGVW